MTTENLILDAIYYAFKHMRHKYSIGIKKAIFEHHLPNSL